MNTNERRTNRRTRTRSPGRVGQWARWGRQLLAMLASFVMACAVVALAPAPASAAAPPPTGNVVLDNDFIGGVDDYVLSMAHQSDGKIIALGRNHDTLDLHLQRLLPNGEPDPSFAEPDFVGSGYLTAWVTVQPDDKIIVSGDVTLVDGIQRPGLVRLHRDGEVDVSFAPIIAGPSTFRANGPTAVQPDGKVVVGGYVFPPPSPDGFYQATKQVLARFSGTGNHDTSFKVQFVQSSYSSAPPITTLLPDGRMYVIGDFAMVGMAGRNGIVRLTSKGEVDPTFVPGGGFAAKPCSKCPLFSGVGARTLAVQADGKVVVGGTFTYFNWTPTNQLVRLNKDGSRDATFDVGSGISMTGTTPSAYPYGATQQGDTQQGATQQGATDQGVTDREEDSATPVEPNAMLPMEVPVVQAIEAQDDGKVIVGGVFGSYRGAQRPGIVRINPNGSVDLTFDPGAGFSGQTNPNYSAVPGVYAMLPSPNGMLAAGNFMSFDQQPAENLAMLAVEPQRAGVFTPLPTPVRVFDSRTDVGDPFYGTRTIDLTNNGEIALPDGATAVAVNLTATGQTASGYAAIDRDDGRFFPPSCSNSSTINWTGPSQTIANATTVGMSGEKKIKVCVMGNGQAHIVVDLLGYYAAPTEPSGPQSAAAAGQLTPNGTSGALFVPISPDRAYDSRVTGGPISGGSKRTLDLAAGAPGTLPAGATALAYNLTVAGTTGTGYLAVAPGGTATAPTASTLNWTGTGQTIANAAQTGLVNRTVEVFAGGGSTHFTLDIVGYFAPAAALPPGTTGLAYLPIAPVRAYDSRTYGGAVSGNPATGGTGVGRTTGLTMGGALPAGTGAITVNLTATGTTGSGFLTSSPLTTPPATSIVNWTRAGSTIANATPIGMSASGTVTTWVGGRYSSQYLVDITGYYVPMAE